jgi:desulfoferrodoxin (superoxide reductase-like protein)
MSIFKTGGVMKKKIICSVIVCAVLSIPLMVFANQTSVAIVAPETAKKGTEVTITINVSHNGNSRFHYTNWVWVKANGKEIGRWEYSSDKLPENEKFTLEVKVKINADTVIEAQGNCNRHGSAGVQSVTIKAVK